GHRVGRLVTTTRWPLVRPKAVAEDPRLLEVVVEQLHRRAHGELGRFLAPLDAGALLVPLASVTLGVEQSGWLVAHRCPWSAARQPRASRRVIVPARP